ncbi:tripartite tricarboxylate transporter substrate binding protein [Afifella pfennigii]|uniref:tripartite tricarboxylate transporter substrate binding protein n=1 Tax=Afifella pfennigii TaxID=209897 RepID=UPI00047B4260|nr:tripartite tricarboxylate transporter substrate binding protein [Afifella pfennigii]
MGRSPGGGLDLHARGLAPYLEKHLPGDSSVVVVNRPGAGGGIALMSVWDADPNGYNLVKTITSSDLINQITTQSLTYKLSEFDFIGSLYYADTGLMVRSDLGWETIDDIRAAAAEKPIVFGTTGHGSTAHIEGIFVYERHLGIPVRFVHYAGTSEVMLAMARGEVQATAFGASTAARFAEEDENLKMLFVWSKEPIEYFEDLPTALDVGITEEEFDTAPPVLGQWRALMTTPGTPEPVLAILREAFLEATSDPEYEAWRVNAKIPKNVIPGEEFGEKVAEIEAGYLAIADELKELVGR